MITAVLVLAVILFFMNVLAFSSGDEEAVCVVAAVLVLPGTLAIAVLSVLGLVL